MEKVFIDSAINSLGISSESIAQLKNKNNPLIQELIIAHPEKSQSIIELYCKVFRVQFVDLSSKDIPQNIISLIPKDLANNGSLSF